MKTLIASAVLAAAVAATAMVAPIASGAATNNAPSSGPMQRGSAFAGDMSVVHQLLFDHNKIKRTVTTLPNGIRTVTESDDPQVAKEIKDHVASMNQRLKNGNVFNVASHTLPTIFANNAKIHTVIEQTPKGVIVTQTSTDPATVAALQGHASEVSDLVQGGMPALMRQVMANGGPMGAGGPRMSGGMGMMSGGNGMMSGGTMGHDGSMPAQMMRQMMQGGGAMCSMHGGSPAMRGNGASGEPAQKLP